MLTMELQLGLALPIHSPIAKGLDLNGVRLEPNHDEVLAGDDAPPRLGNCSAPDQSKCARAKSKCGFEEAFGKIGDRYEAAAVASPQKMVADLLVWHGQPSEEDDGKGHKKKDSCPINKIGTDEENYIIGWPPIKSSRKKELLQRHVPWRSRHRHPTTEIRQRSTAKIRVNGSSSSSSSTRSTNSMYVKVKMEGVAIARKVDLSLHRSYHTLKRSLISMFTDCDQECIEDSERYTLTYQDKEGDWLLAGDVPWKSFIKSVQRLEIVRN